MTDKEFADWLRNTAATAKDPWLSMYEKADELDPQPKEYRAKWPEHKGCLIELEDGLVTVFIQDALHKDYKLHTGAHKLNMIPHDGGERPIDADQPVVIQYLDKIYSAGNRADEYRWVHNGYASDIIYYCPIDPVWVDL